jgi:8-oxo-dGTP diphosphatase
MAQNLSSGDRRDPPPERGSRRDPRGERRSRREHPQERWTATNSAGFTAPAALAVDVVVLTVRDGRLQVLTVERPDGERALPGGFVGETEAPHDTAARKLREKTGLSDLYLEQLGAFADPGRDSRGWIPSIAHLALVPADTEPTDPVARWEPVDADQSLAFDHETILGAALDRVRGKLWWSNIAVGVLPGPFTMAQAREVYQAIAGATYDPSTFARDLRATGLIEPAGHDRRPTGGRPAAVYAFSSREPAWGAGRRKRVSG